MLWPPDRADLLEKTLLLGKIEGRRGRGRQMRWFDGITDSSSMSSVRIPWDPLSQQSEPLLRLAGGTDLFLLGVGRKIRTRKLKTA